MTVEDIEKAVIGLSREDLARFRAWFEEFDAARFDAALARDAASDRLVRLAAEAAAEHRAGRTREI